MEKNYNVIGLMSGTSLDGVDIVLCRFCKIRNRWAYKISNAKTVPYPDGLRDKLSNSINLSGLELTKLDVELAIFFADEINHFLKSVKEDVYCIASHGHTVFHQPKEGFTLQIGNGAVIAAQTHIPVVNNFRVLDVAFGGEGAPLVPTGDKLLFSDYSACVNLGGISNISYNANNKLVAYDVSPCNIPLNYYANKLGLSCDFDGKIASSNEIDNDLLFCLNNLLYYEQPFPKSLGIEWINTNFLNIVNEYQITNERKIATITEHIAQKIALACNSVKGKKILFTGGGANNKFLIYRIFRLLPAKQIIVPDEDTINFKEAIIFALLGLLKMSGKINVLCSATGASCNTSSGIIWKP